GEGIPHDIATGAVRRWVRGRCELPADESRGRRNQLRPQLARVGRARRHSEPRIPAGDGEYQRGSSGPPAGLARPPPDSAGRWPPLSATPPSREVDDRGG